MADEHATHDLEAVASLLDGDLLPADRATAARQVARCPACAALHQELLALSSATAALPAPPRTRDFRLTAADTARLTAAPTEPVPSSARPVVDMRTTTDHATHDLERLSAAVDGTLPAADLPSVNAQLAACDACADLHADLLALIAANRAMPTPERPRDYQLTDADAHRLQRGGIRGWLDRIGSPRDQLSRPLAVGLTTLGLVGVLVGTAPSLLPSFGGAAGSAAASAAASAPSRDLVDKTADGEASAAPGVAAAPAPSAAASAASGDGIGQEFVSEAPAATSLAPVRNQVDNASPDLNAAASGDTQGVAQPELGAPPPGGAGTSETLTTRAAADAGPSLVLVVSTAALLAGIVLFVLRMGARRRHS
jgi:anti-sigma factor RsiW